MSTGVSVTGQRSLAKDVHLRQWGLQRQGHSVAGPRLGQLQLYHCPALVVQPLKQHFVNQDSAYGTKNIKNTSTPSIQNVLW